MASYSPEALGSVVNDLRTTKGLTQEQLGREAGYKGGAGVSISRLEHGQIEPSPERVERIAAALGLTSDELAARAVAKTRTLKRGTGDNSESVMHRRARLQQELDIRRQTVTELEQAFTAAGDRAKTDFLMRLIEIAARVHGAPRPEQIQLVADSIPAGAEAETEAAYRFQLTRSGVEQALAETTRGGDTYEEFADEVALKTLLMGPEIFKLVGGAAALNGVLAAARVRTPAAHGAGNVGGIALLAVAAGGLFLVKQQRNRKQQQELSTKLDEVEAQIAETQPNLAALRELMPRATEILEYNAVHARHALDRWEARIGQGQLEMQSLSPGDQLRYQDFVEIAAAQLAVTTIDFQELMTNRDSELERATALADEILTQARKVITSHV